MNASSSILNIIRVIAMTGIIADHYFQASGIPILVNSGLYMGGGISNGVLCPFCISVWNEMVPKRV